MELLRRILPSQETRSSFLMFHLVAPSSAVAGAYLELQDLEAVAIDSDPLLAETIPGRPPADPESDNPEQAESTRSAEV